MKKIIEKTIAICICLAIFIIAIIIRNIPSASDFYVKYISSNYIRVVGSIFSFIPFSLYEFFIVALVIILLTKLIKIFIKLFKKEFLNSLNKFISLLLFIFVCLDWYFLSASISYGRPPVDIPQYDGQVSPEMIEEALKYYINDFNEISTHFERDEDNAIKMPYSFDELNNSLKKEFALLSEKSSYFSTYTPSVKKLTFSNVFSELHITGVTFAINGESSVNSEIHPCEMPYVMAHELSHIKGVYREDDANLVALYICLNSADEFLRYSGYYSTIYALIDAYNTTFRTSYSNKYPLSYKINAEYATINKFWTDNNLLEKIGTFFNDLFLKTNGNSEGTNDYIDSSDKEDTGEKDENGQQIFIIKEFSPFQKLYFHHFMNK